MRRGSVALVRCIAALYCASVAHFCDATFLLEQVGAIGVLLNAIGSRGALLDAMKPRGVVTVETAKYGKRAIRATHVARGPNS